MQPLGNALLRWDDFHEERTNKIKHMLANQTFTDVTLLCNDDGGVQVAITAHRVILSAASEFFSRVLGREQDKNAVLYLRGASKENVISLLNFIYSGECSIQVAQLHEFVALGRDLMIKSLENYTSEVINKVLVQANANPGFHKAPQQQMRASGNKKEFVRKVVRRIQSKSPPNSDFQFADTRMMTKTENSMLASNPTLQENDLSALQSQNLNASSNMNSEEKMDSSVGQTTESLHNVTPPNMKTEKNATENDKFDDDNNPDDPSPVDETTEESKLEISKPAESQPNPVPTDPILLLEQKISSLLTYDKATQHYICSICKVEARNKTNITEHVELHIEGFLFSCNSCSLTFPNRPTLRRHKYKCKN